MHVPIRYMSLIVLITKYWKNVGSNIIKKITIVSGDKVLVSKLLMVHDDRIANPNV
jgi:hypothetical protein